MKLVLKSAEYRCHCVYCGQDVFAESINQCGCGDAVHGWKISEEVSVEIVNATPHNITFRGENREITFEKTSFLARVSVKEVEVQSPFGDMPCFIQKFGEVEGLPEPKDNVYFIVSAMVKGASDRKDLIAPNTGASAIRNEKGHVIAVTSWIL